MVRANPIDEARRYIAYARDILSQKAMKLDGSYQDIKYVKMAGDTAYKGVLVALDATLAAKSRGRQNVEWYQLHLAKADKRALAKYNEAYQILHLLLGYDGNTNAKVATIGLDLAVDIISWAEARATAAVVA